MLNPSEEVYLWYFSLNFQERSALESFLSPDELKRANRFHFMVDRDRFVKSRGLLRKLLGSYLKTEPQKISFSYGVWGKPYLNGIHFNISHSKDELICAFA